MLKKLVVMSLIGLLASLAVFADGSKKEKDFAEKVKTEIAKLGTGTDAKVSVKLKDGSKVKGYVKEVKDDGFVVINEKTGAAVEVPYSQAKQVKGNNLSTGVKVVLVIGVILAIAALAVLFGS